MASEFAYSGRVQEAPEQTEKRAETARGKNPEKKRRDKRKAASQALFSALQFVSEGADDATAWKALAELIGNQRMLQTIADVIMEKRRNLFRNPSSDFALEPLPGLPENRVTISWPALRPVLDLSRTKHYSKRLFPVGAFREEIVRRTWDEK